MTPAFDYRVYGLRLRADRPLPRLSDARGAHASDICVDLSGRVPDSVQSAEATDWVRSHDLETDDQEEAQTWTLRVGDLRYLRLRYEIEGRHAEFVLDPAGTQVWASWADGVVFEDVTSFLLGPVLGCVLRLRGLPCLHAGVVGIGPRALALAGSKAAGKSTMAAGLAAQGAPVLSDDIAVLAREGECYIVQPGAPRLRLWKPAIESFYGSRDELPRVVSHRNKRYLDLAAEDRATKWRFGAEPLPLAAVYVLGPRDATAATASIRPLSPAQGLLALTAHSYANHFLSREARAHEFAFLGDLVQQVPVRQVERPDAMDAVSGLCRMIRHDFKQLGRPTGT